MKQAKNPVITVLTDFGWRDPYVSSMKGVILSICKNATIVDISHSIPKFNIMHGAYLLAFSVPYFPPGTIHVVVVDPGVGSERLPILVQTKNDQYLIGPDNGIFTLVVERCGGWKKIVKLENETFFLNEISTTFHGRDLFAPVAAHLANGTSIEEFGSEISEIRQINVQEPIVRRNEIEGLILFTDSFGNIITNISKSLFEELKISTGSQVELDLATNTRDIKFCQSYAEVEKNQFLLIIGSRGLAEISMNQGNAAQALNLDLQGRTIIIRKKRIMKRKKKRKR